LPLAISSAVWFFLSRLRRPQLSDSAHPLVELDLPESITQQNLADRPQPASPSHGLPLPTALGGSKVHLTRVLPARYVPPSGFGYPLDGFLPSAPCRFCFTPAALLGFTLRSFLLPRRYPVRFRAGGTHIPFLLPLYPVPKHGAGTAGRGSWALTLPGIPDDRACV
jgi:hypothetical protein